MKLWLLGLFSFLFSLNLYAQNQLLGRVTNKKSENIIGATIILSKSKQAVYSDYDGKFRLKNIQSSDSLKISFIGYKTIIIPIEIKKDEVKRVEIVLIDEQKDLAPIEIKGNQSISKEFAIKSLTYIDIYNTPNSSGDPIKALSVLPSSTGDSEGASTEFRGSANDMSRITINNVPIYNPIRYSQINGMGHFSVFNTEMLQEQKVYASNPPLVFGNTTAGLVEISTKRKVHHRETSLSISLANLGFMYSQPLKNSFYQIFGNYQFSKPFLYINKTPNIKEFNTTDFGINYHINISKNYEANLYSYFINEGYNSNNYAYTYLGSLLSNKTRMFHILNLIYRFKSGLISLNSGFDTSKEKLHFGNLDLNRKNNYLYNNLDIKYYIMNSWSIQGGLSSDFTTQEYNNTFPFYIYAIRTSDPKYSFQHSIKNPNVEFYIYNRFNLGRSIILGGGLRKNIKLLKEQKNYLSYQGNIRYSFNHKNSLLCSFGHYNGYNNPSYNTQQFMPLSAKQYAVEFSHSNAWFDVELATYYKNELQFTYMNEINKTIETPKKIVGFECQFNKQFNNLRATLSYTYLSSHFNYQKQWYNSSNSMNYFIKGSLSYNSEFLGNLTTSFIARPGLFYTPIVGAKYHQNLNIYEPIFGIYNSNKYNSYFKVDLAYNKIIHFKKVYAIYFVSINNLFNQKNQRSHKYSSDYTQILDLEYYNPLSVYAGVQIRF